MIKRIGYLSALIFLYAAVSVLAADISPPDQKVLTLNECINIALANQSDILIGQNSIISAKARETESKSGYFPQVSAQRSGTHIDTSVHGAGSASGDSSSVTITQNIYDGGLRETKVTGARAAADQSEYGLTRTRQTTVFNVTKSFFALLRVKRLALVQDQQVKYLQEQLDIVRARVKLGSAAEVDSLPIEAQLATAQVNQLSARNDVETAAVLLQAAMGLTPQLGFDVAENDIPEKDLQPLDIYVNTALEHRPEIKKTLAAVTQANASVKSARISMRPRPTVTGEYDKSLMQGPDHTFTLSGGLVFDIFDGGNNRAVYRDARAGMSIAEITAAQTAKDVQSDVEQAYLNLISAKQRVDASDISLLAAQKNFDVQQARYKQGLAIPLDLLNAQLQLTTAQSNLAQSRYDYYTSGAQLEYATGTWGGPK
jgi:outer membrane protein TolC